MHPLKELNDRFGQDNTIFVLNVSYSTFIKWRAYVEDPENDTKKSSGSRRCPSNVAVMLAHFYLHLLSRGWTDEQVIDAVRTIRKIK